jgi:hypothetical protein
MGQVDSIEQHRQLGRVELRPQGVVVELRKPKTTLFEALVHHDKSSVVPGQKLHAVPTLRDENEEMACVKVLLPLRPDNGAEPIY